MVTARLVALIGAAIALAGLAAGCKSGSPNRAPVYPVKGSVSAKGQGLAHVRVTFIAQDRQDGPALETDVLTGLDGQFTATTYEIGDGLPPGRYAVLLVWSEVVTDDPAPNSDRLRGRYNNRQKPAYTIEVKPEPNTLPPFDLK
ncbi:hypothetical protein J8F10_33755 [Gemmata sp. G18]|uniref:Carboxypeptidase regulatory-like domain-containing protein n=1 Tax=Gemmata palustris TaxID=2822762 RepID=A0ABS5C2L7_9BACT|nr:hypothetical protein [Gemmata palustris]MBP3960220.1 hypothetical protein [Gemmata palustris]